MNDFERADQFTQQAEGGYVNNPLDPGGETNFGITVGTWQRWCKAKGLPVKPMRNLTRADVTPIYREWYWNPLASHLPWPYSAAIYDCCVNHGLGDLKPFDESGDEAGATWILWRVNQLCPNGTPLQKALAVCDARQELYDGIVRRRPSQKVFMQGWKNRLRDQRAWLKANAIQGSPRVFMRDPSGTNIVWDGKATVYGGQAVNADWVSQMALAYPPGAKTTLGKLRLTVYSDGALQLERAP